MNRMDPENSAVFAQQISEKLGASASDQQLVTQIRKRLSVKAIDTAKVPDELEMALVNEGYRVQHQSTITGRLRTARYDPNPQNLT